MRGRDDLPNKRSQAPCTPCIGCIGVPEAGLQRRLFDRYPTGEADEGAQNRDQETQPAPQRQANTSERQQGARIGRVAEQPIGASGNELMRVLDDDDSSEEAS